MGVTMRPDPDGYRITYTEDGERFILTRIPDLEVVGEYDTRDAAIDAAGEDSP